MTIDAILLAIAPEMANVSEERRAIIIGLCTPQVGAVFGTERDLAIAYLSAHTITMGDRIAGGAGAISSLKEGDLSIGYQKSNASPGDKLSETSYGSEFVRLRRQCVMSPMTSANESDYAGRL